VRASERFEAGEIRARVVIPTPCELECAGGHHISLVSRPDDLHALVRPAIPNVRTLRLVVEDHEVAHLERAGRGRVHGAGHRCRVGVLVERGDPNIGWLFPDPVAAAKDYYKRTGIFPIMHLVGVRRALAEQHPWLPGAVLKAFERAKTIALEKLSDTSSTKVTLPFIEERLMEARALMGQDFWPYGLEASRKTLETFLRHHHTQGLSSRLVKAEDLFHAGTHETFKL
jgi:hypothetical protein